MIAPGRDRPLLALERVRRMRVSGRDDEEQEEEGCE